MADHGVVDKRVSDHFCRSHNRVGVKEKADQELQDGQEDMTCYSESMGTIMFHGGRGYGMRANMSACDLHKVRLGCQK